MPLEMFDGKTGQRLIARLPVSQYSYALIETDIISRLRVYHPPNLMHGGYPALSPVLSTALPLIAPMLRRRQELRQLYGQALRRLDDQETALESADPLEAALLQMPIDLERASLANTSWLINRPIICSSIMVGRQLTLHLPKAMFEAVATVSAGTVQDIEIHKAPADQD